MNRRGFLLGLVTAPAVAMLPDVVRPSVFARAVLAAATTAGAVLDRVATGSIYLDTSSDVVYLTGNNTWEPVTGMPVFIAGPGAPMEES